MSNDESRTNIRSGAPWEALVEVSKLIDPRMLVEIEADAIVDDDSR